MPSVQPLSRLHFNTNSRAPSHIYSFSDTRVLREQPYSLIRVSKANWSSMPLPAAGLLWHPLALPEACPKVPSQCDQTALDTPGTPHLRFQAGASLTSARLLVHFSLAPSSGCTALRLCKAVRGHEEVLADEQCSTSCNFAPYATYIFRCSSRLTARAPQLIAFPLACFRKLVVLQNTIYSQSSQHEYGLGPCSVGGTFAVFSRF